jgi:hypothetical protein
MFIYLKLWEVFMVVRILGAAALLACMGLTSTLATAEQGHELTSIKGDLGIDMKAYDHAMAGAVRDFVVWGSVNEAAGTSELIMRRDGQDVKAVFQKTGQTFGGVVEHETGEGKRTTNVRFSGLDRQKNEFSFTVNGEPVRVTVASEDFRNNHFIKPTYTIISQDGAAVSFKFEGQACYNYSLHILTMMIAAIRH